jgi:hypothetical protein
MDKMAAIIQKPVELGWRRGRGRGKGKGEGRNARAEQRTGTRVKNKAATPDRQSKTEER